MTGQRLKAGMRVVIASHNQGKVREFGTLFQPYGLEVVSAGDLGLGEPNETESSFEGNARLKAVAAAKASGMPALADDSGLEVVALDGAPGIYSARWAGPEKDFQAAMRRVWEEARARVDSQSEELRADFRCVLCLAWPDGVSQIFEGRVDGQLIWPPRGKKGFGYDPIFLPDNEKLTFGEMDADAKHAISHRAWAFWHFIEGAFDANKS